MREPPFGCCHGGRRATPVQAIHHGKMDQPRRPRYALYDERQKSESVSVRPTSLADDYLSG
ncbi:MAG: hypothetical protein NTZ71_10330 [Planctomycetota bacterium]|nr:hypothetical protein [Planctomycetota bacterium]